MKYVCPQCGEDGDLATVEAIVGYAEMNKVVPADDDGRRKPVWSGTTDVSYDSSTTIGISCGACGWRFPEPTAGKTENVVFCDSYEGRLQELLARLVEEDR